ncbi:MAG TPA: SdpI family protein [Longimicrobiales bacterium]
MRWRWLGAVVVAAEAAFALAAWPHLPERVVVHWSASFQPDGWGSRLGLVGLPPLIALGLWLLLPLLRRIDPRRANYERWEPTFWLLLNVLLLLTAIMDVALVGYNLGWPIDMHRVLLATLGLLFVALGNYLPRVRSNWWIGIRTPWTLSSERVWRDTHRLGGRTFVAGGLVTLAAALLPVGLAPWVALAGLVVAGFVPVVYSYVLWRRETGAGDESSPKTLP